MKKAFVFVFVYFFVMQFCYCQISKGFWQEKTSNVSDAYLGGYYFTDSTFEYTINGYDGLNPINALGGKYTIKNNVIYFTVEYIKKTIGGTLCRSMTTTLNDTWSIEGGKLTTTKLKSAVKATAKIELFKDYIIIDKQKFYKIDTN